MMVQYIKTGFDKFVHSGVQYLEFLELLAKSLCPTSYMEIGTAEGTSLAKMKCDALCIDPNFRIATAPALTRRRTLFHQMTSDEFFATYNVRDIFPAGPDICFLDGLHRFEFLLRDFINIEAICRRNSLILMHDCLPVNERMAERTMRIDEGEDPSTRSAWTGDVWRILPTLKQHRPDLRIMALDCGPTGLIACTHLDPDSGILARNYDRIVDDGMNLSLGSLGVDQLWRMFPMMDTRRLRERPEDITAIFNIASPAHQAVDSLPAQH
jgi:hypothetical protein